MALDLIGFASDSISIMVIPSRSSGLREATPGDQDDASGESGIGRFRVVDGTIADDGVGILKEGSKPNGPGDKLGLFVSRA